MDLYTATLITGGIILGVALLIIGLLICFVLFMLKKRRKSIEPKRGKKTGYIVGAVGIIISLISVTAMFVTDSTDNVKKIMSAMSSDSTAIYEDNYYVKTDLPFNGGSDRYKLQEVEGAFTGIDPLYSLKGYDKFDILVSMNTNISGEVYAPQQEKEKVEKYYENYDLYTVGAILDKQDDKMTTVEKKADSKLYAQLADESMYTPVSEDKIKYIDDITSTKCCIFWATSDDKLVSRQIKIFPKDNNGRYIRMIDDEYYELAPTLNETIDEYFK